MRRGPAPRDLVSSRLMTNPPPTSRPGEAKSPFKGKTGLARIWNAFGYSLDGLSEAWRH